MSKFYGKVGFVIDHAETQPGIWEEQIEERNYYGTITQDNRRWEKGESINDNLILSNYISILADTYAYKHIGAIRYVYYLGTKWAVKSISIKRPRIELTLGGIYNE